MSIRYQWSVADLTLVRATLPRRTFSMIPSEQSLEKRVTGSSVSGPKKV
jgi:hypothetical protein